MNNEDIKYESKKPLYESEIDEEIITPAHVKIEYQTGKIKRRELPYERKDSQWTVKLLREYVNDKEEKTRNDYVRKRDPSNAWKVKTCSSLGHQFSQH